MIRKMVNRISFLIFIIIYDKNIDIREYMYKGIEQLKCMVYRE